MSVATSGAWNRGAWNTVAWNATNAQSIPPIRCSVVRVRPAQVPGWLTRPIAARAPSSAAITPRTSQVARPTLRPSARTGPYLAKTAYVVVPSTPLPRCSIGRIRPAPAPGRSAQIIQALRVGGTVISTIPMRMDPTAPILVGNSGDWLEVDATGVVLVGNAGDWLEVDATAPILAGDAGDSLQVDPNGPLFSG